MPTLADMVSDYKRAEYPAEQVALDFESDRSSSSTLRHPSACDIRPTPTDASYWTSSNGRMPAYVDTSLNIVDVEDVAVGTGWLHERRGRTAATFWAIAHDDEGDPGGAGPDPGGRHRACACCCGRWLRPLGHRACARLALPVPRATGHRAPGPATWSSIHPGPYVSWAYLRAIPAAHCARPLTVPAIRTDQELTHVLPLSNSKIARHLARAH